MAQAKDEAGEADAPRVLFLFDNLSISGADKVALSLLRSAKAAALPWDGLVFMDDGVGAGSVGVELLSFASPAAAGESLWARVAKALARVAKLRGLAKGYDLVVPVTPPTAPFADLACWGLAAKVAPWVHYDRDGVAMEPLAPGRRIRDAMQRLAYRWWVPLHRRVVFASPGAKRSFESFERSSSRWIVVGNAFEPSSMFEDQRSTSEEAVEADRAQGLIPLMLLGRVARQKRWEWALEAMEELERSDPGRFSLHIVGDGPEMPRLRRMLADPRWSGLRLRAFGFDKAPAAALAKSAGLLLTSLHEAWPTVILEAFHSGVPVFSIDCPSGPSDLLGRHGERGWLSASPSGMAAQISEAFKSDPASDPRLRAAAAMLAAHGPAKVLADWVAGAKALSGADDGQAPGGEAGRGPAPPPYAVAMGLYNGAGFVAEQIRSVLGQLPAPALVVARDDASTDSTLERARSAFAGAAGIVDLRGNASNVGINANFEAALRACAGYPVAFLCDQDDFWLPGRAADMAREMERSGALYLFTDALIADAQLRPGGSLFAALGVDRGFVSGLAAGDPRAFRTLLRAPRATGAASCVDPSMLGWAAPIPAQGWVHDEWLCFWAALAGRARATPAPSLLYRQHGANAVGVPSEGLDWSTYAKRWRQARSGAHGRALARKAAALRCALDAMAPAARLACRDANFDARLAMAWRWLAYLEARAGARWGAALSQHVQFSSKPLLAWALDLAERIVGAGRP